MKFRLLCGLHLVLDFSVCCYDLTSLPDIEDQQFIQNCVKIHNDFRSKVSPSASNMLRMTWDPALAKTAKAWAKKCIFDHNIYLKIAGKVHPEFTPVGENIWTGSLHMFSVEAAIRDWYNEVKDYDFESRVCAKTCGHYTQVVWATSYKVGCAVQFCRRVSGFESLSNGAHFVCNYGKAGNYPVHPYKQGRACSDCKADKCVQNLCENPERDQLKSYFHWYPDWDVPKHGTKSPPKTHPQAPDPVSPRPTRQKTPQKPPHTSTAAPTTSVSSQSTCDSYCIAVVILRISFMLLTFGTVATLSKKYPHMFIYDKSLNL